MEFRAVRLPGPAAGRRRPVAWVRPGGRAARRAPADGRTPVRSPRISVAAGAFKVAASGREKFATWGSMRAGAECPA
jgi:hypothetical protein